MEKHVVVIGSNILEIKNIIGVFNTRAEALNFIVNYGLRDKAKVIPLISESEYETQRQNLQEEDPMYIASERNNWYE